MAKNTKLELTWIGKDKRPRLEPRVLVEDPTKSYHASVRHGPNDIFDNMLIHGDNLLALKALEQQFAGKVKCIYIDPPFNTGAAFDNYEDGIEHSIWLNLMRERFEILHRLLDDTGAIFVHLDDNEADYCKILLDEIFGRAQGMEEIQGVGAMNGMNFRDAALCTYEGFREELVYQGHVRFVLDGIRYFAFPRGPHSYGVCLWSDMSTGGHARWTFDSEEALLQANLFAGRSLADRISEVETFSESEPFA